MRAVARKKPKPNRKQKMKTRERGSVAIIVFPPFVAILA